MIKISRYMIASNDVFKAIVADTSTFIIKGGWFPSSLALIYNIINFVVSYPRRGTRVCLAQPLL